MRNAAADGLRGFAAFNVVLCHYVAAFWPELLRKNYTGLEVSYQSASAVERVLGSPVVTLFFNGHFPVLIFFVLSGFVLAQPAVGNDYDRVRSRFWARYTRLNVPIAAACLISWLALKAGLYFNQEASVISDSAWLAAFFREDMSVLELLGYAAVGGLLGDGALVPPLWTLRIELIGSLMLLAVLALAPKNRQLLCLALACISLVVAQPSDLVYFLCFFAGAALNWAKGTQAPGLALLVTGLVLGAYQGDSRFYSFLPVVTSDAKTFYNSIGAVFLVWGVCVAGSFERAFASPFAQYLGRISYSLYLIHFVALASLTSLVVAYMGTDALGLVVAMILYLLFSVGLAGLLTRFVDGPAIVVSTKLANWIETGGFGRAETKPAQGAKPGVSRVYK